MEYSRTQKIILGIFTILPFVFFPFILAQVFQFVLNMVAANQHGEPEVSEVLLAVFSFITPIILLSLLSIGLLIFYIIHVVGNKRLETAERLVWILLFIFFGIIAFPIYWFMRIWNSLEKT